MATLHYYILYIGLGIKLTSNALSNKVISLAASLHKDPALSLRSLSAAEKLYAQLKPEDIVIWPADLGGLAWKALEKEVGGRRGRSKKKPFRIYCVIPDCISYTEQLWKHLDTAASSLNRHIIPVRLKTASVITAESRYPGYLEKILNRLFPPVSSPEEETAAGSLESAEGLTFFLDSESTYTVVEDLLPASPVCSSWVEQSAERIYIPAGINLIERFLAASAASAAGLLPLIPINKGEAPVAAAFFDEVSYKFLILSDEDWDAAVVFKSVSGIGVLSPLSETDLSVALEWAGRTDDSVLIVMPGKKALPGRKIHEKSWDTQKSLLIKERKEGSGGSVLFVVPGLMAKEAVKAADRLVKENYSVAVMSLRRFWPADTGVISETADHYDLVFVADPGNLPGGLKSELGFLLTDLCKTHIVVAPKYMNAREMAELAGKVLREDRFHRTVDDVRKDRWR